MNFDEIKRKMDADAMEGITLPTNIKQLQESKIPIQKVRQSMKGEIITQLIIIVLFFAAPSFLKMDQLPKGIYYILQFITSLITLLYLAKMTWFLNKTSDLTGNSRDTVVAFIHDLKLTLEVYKTAIIAGSLILPISILTLFLGSGKMHIGVRNVESANAIPQEGIFLKFISLDMSLNILLISIGTYLIVAAFIYIVTVKWTDKLYGVHIDKLKETLKEFEI
jgi:hypothetical protein